MPYLYVEWIIHYGASTKQYDTRQSDAIPLEKLGLVLTYLLVNALISAGNINAAGAVRSATRSSY